MHLNGFKVLLVLSLLGTITSNTTLSNVVQLTQYNINEILASNEIVIINFRLNYSRRVKNLDKIFEEVANTVVLEYPDPGKIVLGEVDAVKELTVVTKFESFMTDDPTIKVVKNGILPNPYVQYRGDFTYEGILSFVRKQTENPIVEFDNINNIPTNTRRIIGFFTDGNQSDEYDTLRRVATNLKDLCNFYVISNNHDKNSVFQKENMIVFTPDKKWSIVPDILVYTGNKTNFSGLYAWALDKCTPLVTEVISDHPLDLATYAVQPFLILYHAANDSESVRKFRKIVEEELISEKDDIKFVTSNVSKLFYHPMKKPEVTLPLIAIDTPRHMYILPNTTNFGKPGKLKRFVQDLHSGELHRAFHYGPIYYH